MAGHPEDDDSLFVRVEGYKVILQDLEAVRQIIENMKEAVTVMNQVDKVKEKSIETFLENVDRLNDKLDSIDAEMPQMRDMEQGGSVTIEREQSQQVQQQQPADSEEVVDDSIHDLQDELQGLKDELDKLD
ncbi:MAG: hypothetical protein SV186_03520 [Candidatus Nanohaloarchaea archaeon]|nr:hypothetical protein [Candidatus Nanohaloarchaea archaeon]